MRIRITKTITQEFDVSEKTGLHVLALGFQDLIYWFFSRETIKHKIEIIAKEVKK